MKTVFRFLALALFASTLAACARFEAGQSSSFGAITTAPDTPQVASTAPSEDFQRKAIADFLPADVSSVLSEKERSEAASAQFFALQYGRVGAFREWSGESGAKGEISVGPYIKVNNLDCREFTHTVVLNSNRSSKSGTSCREANGQWSVVG